MPSHNTFSINFPSHFNQLNKNILFSQAAKTMMCVCQQVEMYTVRRESPPSWTLFVLFEHCRNLSFYLKPKDAHCSSATVQYVLKYHQL